MTDDELALFLRSQEDHRVQLEVVVDACLYACCGRAWQSRDGYEQTYQGYIQRVSLPDAESRGGARLVSRGAGTVSYFATFGFDHVLDVRAL